MVACGLLMLAGAVAAARWGHLAVVPPWTSATDHTPPTPRTSALRFLWHLDVAVISGLTAGLLAAGPGGRLVMRLLAVTAGSEAQGRITEAEETVGRITVGGTIGFIVFVGLFGGLVVGALYVALRRWLPPARLGALVFAGFLLVVFATRVEPLRADNLDFDLVGPAWLALTAFAALAVFHAFVVAAVAGRLSRSLPVLSGRGRALAAYLPVLVLLLPGPFFAVVLVVAGLVILALQRPEIGAWSRSPAATTAGRVVLAGVGLVALPGFAGAVRDILR